MSPSPMLVLSARELDDLISRLPLLESLKLGNCPGLKEFKISNHHLRDLVLSTNDFRQLELLQAEAKIETPSLVSFCYTGNSMIRVSPSAPNLLNVSIRIYEYPEKNYGMEWYSNLIYFLLELNNAKNVHILCFSEKVNIYTYTFKLLFSQCLKYSIYGYCKYNRRG